MRSPESRSRLIIYILILAATLACVVPHSAHAASAASNAQTLADSLTRAAAGLYAAEPTVQDILDQLGWNLSATTDEISLSSLCATAGPVSVRILAEHTGLANESRLLWYPAGARTDTTEVLAGIASVDDSTVFQLSSLTDLAWLYSPRAGTNWYSEIPYNYDQRDHLKLYPAPQPGTYIFFWEDLAWLADGDFNDLVVLISTPSTPVEVTARATTSDSVFTPGMNVCIDVDVTLNGCNPQPVSLAMIEGDGTFTPQTASSDFSVQHCFQPPSDGLFTFVFEATTASEDIAQDTVNILLSPQKVSIQPEVEIAISRSNAITVCRPDSICIPFSVSSSCDLVDIRTGPQAHVDLTDSSLCVYAFEPVEFCVPLVAQDACGNKDSIQVCFIIDTSEPTDITCPETIDTVLCLPGFVCVPITTSGGAPPIAISAVAPAAYSDGHTCLYAEESGTYDVYTIVDNADCPPETCHSVVNVQMNRTPVIGGLPDTVMTVCRDGQFCFGPISASDPDGNLSAMILWDGPGTLTGDEWCYISPREEEIDVVFRAQDQCNRFVLDTLRVRFVNPSSPTITFGSATFDLCEAGDVCVPFSIANVGQLPLTLSLDGPGTLDTVDSLICVQVSASGTTQLTLHADDACGGGTAKLLSVNATINEPPVVSCTGPESDFFCVGDDICFGFSVSDPGDDPANIEISGFGSIQQRQALLDGNQEVCFTASTAGDYNVRVIATDDCGASDTCFVTGTVILNHPPSVAVYDTSIFLCGPEEICVPVACEDVDGNLETCLVDASAGGFYDAGVLCFTPDTAGVYTISATATDACGDQRSGVARVTVSYNDAPTVSVSGLLNRDADPGDTVCFAFATSDPNGNIAGVTVLDNYLNHDDAEVCVRAVALSVVCARIVVTDSCGLADTITVCVSAGPGPNPQPKPQLPDTVVTTVCTPGDVCVPFTVGETSCPPQVLSALGGAWIDVNGPNVCMTIPEPGIYETGVVASDTCGAETGFVVIIVEPTVPPQIECPADTEVNVCADTTICLTATVSDLDNDIATVGASYGTATLQQNGIVEVCVPVDTSGVYQIDLTVIDECAQADTCSFALTVHGNAPPILDVPSPSSMTICGGGEICIPITCDDPDGNLIGCAPLDLGDAVWDGEVLCITPTVGGDYQWVFRAVDACGAETLDTLALNIVFNTPPEIHAEPEDIVDICDVDTVCHPFTVTDAEGNLATVTTTKGVIHDNAVCLLLNGFVCFTITATDSCGATATRNVCLTANPSAAPEIDAPDSLYRLLCAPEKICFNVALGEDSSDWQFEVTPLGEYDPVSSTVCFTPDTSGTYTIITSTTNTCDISASDTTLVVVRYNAPPEVSGPNYVSLTNCASGSVCFGGVVFSDPEGNIAEVVIDSGNGEINPANGVICFDPDTAGTYCFRVLVQDSCGMQATKSLCAVVGLNVPPTVEIAELEQDVYYSAPTEICFNVVADDDNFNQAISLQKIEGAGTFTGRNGTTVLIATHCFTADTSGCYRFVFEVTDGCGATDRDTMTVCVMIEPPDSLFRVCIDTVYSLNGREATVKVRASQVMSTGGFDFLICFDPTALTLSRAFADSALQGWEYFTYRVGDAASCPPCIEGQVRVIGIADMDNGSPHPPEEAFFPRGPMVGLTFFVTPDRLFIGQCIPIDFCSYDCGDNTISHSSGDTLFVANDGVPDTCIVGKVRPVLKRIDFCEGRLCIIPPPDDRGDMNLNSIANEVGDAVLYSRFFIYGDEVFDPDYRENQILASDVNCDGLVLTVADLIYMIRIITGDATAIDCPDVGTGGKVLATTHAGRVLLERNDDQMEVWLESDRDVGGVYVRLSSSIREQAEIDWGEQTAELKRDVRQSGRELRVLLQARRSGARLPGGLQKLFSFPATGGANWQLVESQAATSEAEIIQVEMVSATSVLPSSFALLPNYPNPFNAATQIRFALGAPSDWKLTIYNVLGQMVDQFDGSSEAGEVSIQWDAKTLEGKSLASGIYFARLTAGQFDATRQMVLLK